MKIKDLTKKETVLLLEVISAATRCSEEADLQDLFARLNRIVLFNYTPLFVKPTGDTPNRCASIKPFPPVFL